MKGTLGLVTVIMIFAGTLFVIVTEHPEGRRVTSEDGRVTLEGELTPEAQISIESAPHGVGPWTAVIAGEYQAFPSDFVLTTPLTVSFTYATEDLGGADPRALRVGFYDEEFGMWRTVPTAIADNAASALIYNFDALFALLLMDAVAVPNFEVEIAELLSAAPDEAVGYELVVAYAQVPGDFVILEGTTQSGGCGGRYRIGESTTMTSIGDKFGDGLEYQIMVIWQLGEGCGRAMIQ